MYINNNSIELYNYKKELLGNTVLTCAFIFKVAFDFIAPVPREEAPGDISVWHRLPAALIFPGADFL